MGREGHGSWPEKERSDSLGEEGMGREERILSALLKQLLEREETLLGLWRGRI